METISRKTLLRLRNFWYLVDLLVQVPKDIILEPLTIGMMDGCRYSLLKNQTLKGKSLNILHNMAAGRSCSWLGPTQTLPVETGRGNRVQVVRPKVCCGAACL